jgi:hypothetical protein
MFYVDESVGVNNLLLFNHLLRKLFKLEEAGIAASKIIGYHVGDDMGRGTWDTWKGRQLYTDFDMKSSCVEPTWWSWV